MSFIVVGYDGTDGSRAALDEAVRLAAEIGAEIRLVFSFEAPRIGGELHDLDVAIAERGAEVLVHGEHQAAAAAAGVKVTTEFRKAEPADGLIDAARELEARYIVVGSYGEKPLKSALVGSTPSRLLHLSEVPVLVVRAGE